MYPFSIFQKMLWRESPEMIRSFWGDIFLIARGPLNYNDLQKVHALVQFWLRYGIFLVDYFLDHPNFSKKMFSFEFSPETLAKVRRSHLD